MSKERAQDGAGDGVLSEGSEGGESEGGGGGMEGPREGEDFGDLGGGEGGEVGLRERRTKGGERRGRDQGMSLEEEGREERALTRMSSV